MTASIGGKKTNRVHIRKRAMRAASQARERPPAAPAPALALEENSCTNARCEPCPSQQPRAYRVVCISIYDTDDAALDEKVRDLKARGLSYATRSGVIRAALDLTSVDALAVR